MNSNLNANTIAFKLINANKKYLLKFTKDLIELIKNFKEKSKEEKGFFQRAFGTGNREKKKFLTDLFILRKIIKDGPLNINKRTLIKNKFEKLIEDFNKWYNFRYQRYLIKLEKGQNPRSNKIKLLEEIKKRFQDKVYLNLSILEKKNNPREDELNNSREDELNNPREVIQNLRKKFSFLRWSNNSCWMDTAVVAILFDENSYLYKLLGDTLKELINYEMKKNKGKKFSMMNNNILEKCEKFNLDKIINESTIKNLKRLEEIGEEIQELQKQKNKMERNNQNIINIKGKIRKLVVERQNIFNENKDINLLKVIIRQGKEIITRKEFTNVKGSSGRVRDFLQLLIKDFKNYNVTGFNNEKILDKDIPIFFYNFQLFSKEDLKFLSMPSIRKNTNKKKKKYENPDIKEEIVIDGKKYVLKSILRVIHGHYTTLVNVNGKFYFINIMGRNVIKRSTLKQFLEVGGSYTVIYELVDENKKINIPSQTLNNSNNNNNNNFGGSQFIHIPNFGRRKVRYQKNGRPYVIVNKKRMKL